MNKVIKTILEFFVVWCVGGSVYFLMETAWRADHTSHWSMLILGGICTCLVGLVNQLYFTWNMNLFLQMFIGSIIITVSEFVTGCIVNLWLSWNVWDYSHLPFNVMGQICIPFMILWFFLSALIIFVDDIIRYKLFGEENPHYYFFNKK